MIDCTQPLQATNPFKHIENYTAKFKKLYMPNGAVSMTPHIYMVALAAYKNMTVMGTSQCVLISGESGAGKTESAKHFLNHVLAFGDADGDASSSLEKRITDTQPLLEAFGNAKTVCTHTHTHTH